MDSPLVYHGLLLLPALRRENILKSSVFCQKLFCYKRKRPDAKLHQVGHILEFGLRSVSLFYGMMTICAGLPAKFTVAFLTRLTSVSV